jgi:hypothetical protein
VTVLNPAQAGVDGELVEEGSDEIINRASLTVDGFESGQEVTAIDSNALEAAPDLRVSILSDTTVVPRAGRFAIRSRFRTSGIRMLPAFS